MIKTAIFDLDGTLADTLTDLGTAMNAALASQQLPGCPMEAYRTLVGNGIEKLVRDAMADGYTPDGAMRVKAAFQRYYTDHCMDYTAAYDGMDAVLRKLADDGVITAVISNKPQMFVPKILKKLYPEHRFAYAWGQQDGIPRKPSPDSLHKLIGLCGCDRSEALYVGDSDVDVVFAHSAGVRVCGVSWGFRGADELRRAGADEIVDSPKELYCIIKNNY